MSIIGEPSNEQRALRIDALFIAYSEITDDNSDALIIRDYLDLACVLADMRHWCDLHSADFFAALDLSYQHYLEERADAAPT